MRSRHVRKSLKPGARFGPAKGVEHHRAHIQLRLDSLSWSWGRITILETGVMIVVTYSSINTPFLLSPSSTSPTLTHYFRPMKFALPLESCVLVRSPRRSHILLSLQSRIGTDFPSYLSISTHYPWNSYTTSNQAHYLAGDDSLHNHQVISYDSQ